MLALGIFAFYQPSRPGGRVARISATGQAYHARPLTLVTPKKSEYGQYLRCNITDSKMYEVQDRHYWVYGSGENAISD
jgi:hypothetical protein